MQNSESGRKINQAVNTTSRAVGGAISQAKGAFSSWWSSITTAPPSTNPTAVPNGPDSGDGSEAAAGLDFSVTFQNHKDMEGLDMAGVSIHLAGQEETQEQPQGIVEIGREAELLDKTSNPAEEPKPTAIRPSGCGGDVAASSTSSMEHNSGDVFIV